MEEESSMTGGNNTHILVYTSTHKYIWENSGPVGTAGTNVQGQEQAWCVSKIGVIEQQGGGDWWKMH